MSRLCEFDVKLFFYTEKTKRNVGKETRITYTTELYL
jgi:hypothetical protein